jgi:DNA-binding NtrC family response regulator
VSRRGAKDGHAPGVCIDDPQEGGPVMTAKTSPSFEAPAAERAAPLVVGVDDEPQVLASLTRLLREEPFDFRTTTDPEDALAWIRTERVALVIADYRMPGMSGTTLLQLAKSTSPRTRRILLTGYPGEAIVIRTGEAGLMDLVGKPWDDERLKRMIRGRIAEAQADQAY